MVAVKQLLPGCHDCSEPVLHNEVKEGRKSIIPDSFQFPHLALSYSITQLKPTSMKMIHLIAACIGLSFVSCAQDVNKSEVPSVVLNAFQAKYPNAEDVDWEKKGALYNVDFEIITTDHEAWLDASGKIVKHEQEITKKEIPSVIADVLEQHFKEYRVDDVDKIDKDGATYYRIELDSNMGDRTIVFDAKAHEVTDTSLLY